MSSDVPIKDMQRAQPISLNRLSYDAVIQALECIRSIRPEAPIVDHVYVDTGSNFNLFAVTIYYNYFLTEIVGDPEYYKSQLIRALGEDFSTFTIEKKADSKFKVVSAASIIAKVTRDSLLRVWSDETVSRGQVSPAVAAGTAKEVVSIVKLGR